MANVIKIKKGLDINLAGKAPKVEVQVGEVHSYGVVPDFFPGFVPRLEVQVGDRVQAGSALVYHKDCPKLKLTAPVSGEVVDVKRGAKRKILYIEIKPDITIEYKNFDVKGIAQKSTEELIMLLGESGFLSLFRNRPYDRVINPNITPRDIYITAYQSAPLEGDALELIGEDQQYLQGAVDLLSRLTIGRVHISTKAGSGLKLTNCEIHEVDGPHPAGNASVVINKTRPINKGENVWVMGITELALLGRFLATGRVDLRHKVVFAGSRMESAGYAEVIAGADIMELCSAKLDKNHGNVRLIDGNPLTGTQVLEDRRHMSPFHSLITAIPEGDDVHEMFGWASLSPKRFSVNRAYPSAFLGKSRAYDIDARLKGGPRAIIVSNEYDKVFPMDIFPEQLIKSIIAFDIDKMEALGIYEVAPEDFALCEFVDTSKLELQYIVRKGLDQLYKELN
ncbi:Na(+)-translocating NADH-quinone reductase subunit A [Porphyromonas levii]|uniref:Na(+)-translocating NADH-quinone reductase subunit A n=1 Tax=Porphyromonas levii TaxID=28114 RepID=UPI0003667DAA|nr:Na(+)-translocating NADH-quinone reductase subunit A [Porphyromonas levii]